MNTYVPLSIDTIRDNETPKEGSSMKPLHGAARGEVTAGCCVATKLEAWEMGRVSRTLAEWTATRAREMSIE